VLDDLQVTEVAKGPTQTDWAYAAGFVDGEGCIAVVRSFVAARKRYYYGVHIVVANRDRAVLEWMQSLWGGWVVAFSRGQENSRQAWHWRCPTGISAKPFLHGIQPWLRVKPAQCTNALAMIELMTRSRGTLGPYKMPPEWIEEQENLYWIQRKLNHRGNAEFVNKRCTRRAESNASESTPRPWGFDSDNLRLSLLSRD
jgi:hypothetical protein